MSEFKGFSEASTCSAGPRIVEGGFEVEGYAPRAPEDLLARLDRVAHGPDVKDFCTPGNGRPWSLLTAVIRIDSDDPVNQAADHLARLLLAGKEEWDASD